MPAFDEFIRAVSWLRVRSSIGQSPTKLKGTKLRRKGFCWILAGYSIEWLSRKTACSSVRKNCW